MYITNMYKLFMNKDLPARELVHAVTGGEGVESQQRMHFQTSWQSSLRDGRSLTLVSFDLT